MNLAIIERNKQRVLTTAQLAESYGTDNKVISNNFNRNKERYQVGKHFTCLIGNEKNEFLDLHQIEDGSRNAHKLYLWTEKGAWLHAKSLNADQAWDAYEILVDDYYRIIEQPSTNKLLLQTALHQEEKLEAHDERLGYLEENMRMNGAQEYRINKNGRGKVVECLGGKDSNAYKKISKKVFSQFWNEFKRYFEVPRYGELPKKRFEEGIRYIQEWTPDTGLRIDIKTLNEQTHFDFHSPDRDDDNLVH